MSLGTLKVQLCGFVVATLSVSSFTTFAALFARSTQTVVVPYRSGLAQTFCLIDQ